MTQFRGTSLTDSALTGGVLTTHWAVKAHYHWDAGPAMTRYLNGFQNGQILATHCPQCRRTLIPPRAFCELCFRPLDQWTQLQDTGRINTYSISYVNWDASRRRTPEIPAVIEIDGASPGMAILHKISEAGDTLEQIQTRLRIGTPVQAIWKPQETRQGSITDIEYFRPTD